MASAQRLRSLLAPLALLALLALATLPAAAAPRAVRIVAAENFYGDIAAQLADPDARVVSVLANPASDPHLFEPGISTARAVADADLVIYNGLSYDVWMERLLAGTRSPHRRVLAAAAVLAGTVPAGGSTRGGSARAAPRPAAASPNPHLWYDPAAMQNVARAIAAQLAALDPARRAQYAARLTRFLESMRPVEAQIARLRGRFAGTAVAATEPLAEYLVEAIGLRTSDARFQLAVMNGTEPSARDTAQFERDLREHRVSVLIYNSQVASSAARRLLDIARQSGVPVVGMTETEPPHLTYQRWMLDALRSLGGALEQARPNPPAHPPAHGAGNAPRARSGGSVESRP